MNPTVPQSIIDAALERDPAAAAAEWLNATTVLNTSIFCGVRSKPMVVADFRYWPFADMHLARIDVR
jgi:hypothetical protein